MDYQWYPGHMTKARRMMQENISLIDLLIELTDARAPQSGRNPDIDTLAKGKSRIIVLNKADLADSAATDRWRAYFEQGGILTAAADSRKGSSVRQLKPLIDKACAEKIECTPDGGFLQAEVTSCGLNGKPLIAKGTYEARIACNLWAKNHETGHSDGRDLKEAQQFHPYFTQTGEDRECDGDQYIANMRDGATAGFKYFTFDGTERTISVTGRGTGSFTVSADPDGKNVAATVPMNGEAALETLSGKQALYFMYRGSDAANFTAFTIQ